MNSKSHPKLISTAGTSYMYNKSGLRHWDPGFAHGRTGPMISRSIDQPNHKPTSLTGLGILRMRLHFAPICWCSCVAIYTTDIHFTCCMCVMYSTYLSSSVGGWISLHVLVGSFHSRQATEQITRPGSASRRHRHLILVLECAHRACLPTHSNAKL